MDVFSELERLRIAATKDSQLRERLVATRKKPNPLHEFCVAAWREGYEIFEMDLVDAGETFYATMRRSVNGGGENSPMLKQEDDYYEMFFAAIGE